MASCNASWSLPDGIRFLSALALALIAPASASAHDPPYVVELHWQDATEDVFMWTNRGMIVGRPDGGYSLLCPAAIGVPSSEHVDVIKSAARTFLLGTSGGLLRSEDGGCTWAGVDPLGETAIYALQPQPGAVSRWLLVTGAAEGRTVQASMDQGATWQPVATLADDEYYENIVFAPSDASVVYADGLALGASFAHFLAASSDGGVTWQRYDLPLLDTEGDATVLVVSPTNPQHVLVKAHDNTPALQDRLLLSLDGGQTFGAILQQMDLASASFSQDGMRIYVTAKQGLWVSDDLGGTFQKRVVPVAMTCAVEVEGALLGCGYPQGYDGVNGIGRSTDDGQTFEPLMAFSDVDAPIACSPVSQTAVACESLWTDWAREFQGEPMGTQDAGVPVMGADPVQPGPGAASSTPPSMSSTTSAAPQGVPSDIQTLSSPTGTSPADASPIETPVATPSASTGCACSAPARSAPGRWPSGLSLLALLCLRRRRKVR